MAEIIRVLNEHGRMIERLTEAVRERSASKDNHERGVSRRSMSGEPSRVSGRVERRNAHATRPLTRLGSPDMVYADRAVSTPRDLQKHDPEQTQADDGVHLKERPIDPAQIVRPHQPVFVSQQ